ncbi:MAG TPA: universal stress protein [Planctomycetota bacterium]|nr:universal stress protein [Planctomycetota bacterium]
MSPGNRRAEDFLEMVERAKRGRIKVYLGFAAGVGKTFQMLEEAHVLKKRGVDVVIGYVETHRRAETEALTAGLDIVPRKTFEYRGIVVEEMDLDAVLARKPQVVIVDEIAHTNVPGMKNRKRYQDALELAEAGINVICAFNIQHLESLNDVVQRATKVVVRETVPDSFLKAADQVVTLDLAVEDLIERLRAGKIYGEEKVAKALEEFFKSENLSSLRELALREVAESVDRSSAAKNDETKVRSAPSGRVMVCLSSRGPRAAALLRRGSRLAGRLNTDWYAVYVETPSEAPDRIDAEAQRHLLDNLERARELGAEVVKLQSGDPIAVLLDFARSHRVKHVILGRSRDPWWKRMLGRTFLLRFLQDAGEFDVTVASLDEDEKAE